MVEYQESWLSNVTDEELRDFAIQELGFFAPTVFRMRTRLGYEYVNFEGIKYTKSHESRNAKIDFGYFGPIRIDERGQCIIDLEKVCENLKACKAYIHLVDGKNVGRYISGKTYSASVKSLFDYVNKRISIEEDREK